MTFRTVSATATISFLSLMAGGCGGSSPAAPTPAPTVSDSVRGVSNVAPTTGTALQPGQTVTFSGTPAYSLATADSGTIYMVIQDQANRILQDVTMQPRVAVVKGSGELTLSQTLTLPTSGVTTVVVIFALLPTGASATNATASVSYPVR